FTANVTSLNNASSPSVTVIAPFAAEDNVPSANSSPTLSKSTSNAPVVAFLVKPSPATSLLILAAVTALSAKSTVATVPSKILSDVTAPVLMFAVTSFNNAVDALADKSRSVEVNALPLVISSASTASALTV